MAESPEARASMPETRPAPENAFLKTIRQPRVMLILLGAWNVVAAISEFFVDGKIKGPVAGLSLSWESIPLAALYFYCARDPERYHRVFWLALIQQAAAIAANFYHWGAGDLNFGGIVIPVAVAAGLAALVFLHLFQPKPAEPAAPASTPEAAGSQ